MISRVQEAVDNVELCTIAPVGIFNATFRRLNLPIEADIVDDQMVLRHEGTPEQMLAKVVDELALLDVTLNLTVRSIADRLEGSASDLREMFKLMDYGVDDDDLDDAIAEVQRLSGRLREVVEDFDKGFKA